MNDSNSISKTYHIPEQIKLKTVKNEDQRRFCVVPLKAFLNRKVSGENLRVLAILASYCNRGGYSFVSLKTIAKDLKCSPQNILKHLNKLEAQGIIETKSNYFPMLKGNTRRIIYDEKIKDDDLKEHQFTNADISEILKTNKVINQLETSNEPLKVNQSAIQEDDELASLFNTITRESDLLEAERLLSQGLTPKEVRDRMALGS
jgi:biotin operon repressor